MHFIERKIRNAIRRQSCCNQVLSNTSDRDTARLHPPLRPAFRVRRGQRSTGVDMTRYVRPRASGSPPDLHAFSAPSGDCADIVRSGNHSGLVSGASSPSSSRVRAVQESHASRAGVPAGGDRYGEGYRPTTIQQRRRARPSDEPETAPDGPQQSGSQTSLDRGRSSATRFPDLTSLHFYLVIFEFCDFAEIENR
jgi:hypothetical protein